MTDRRSYRDLVIATSTDIGHIKLHLHNIDQHLNTQNERLNKHDIQLAKNTTWVKTFRWIIGGFVLAIGGIYSKLQGLW